MLKFLFSFLFLTPLCFLSGLWWLVHSLFSFVSLFFFFAFPCFMSWSSLGYMFGCDYFSYGLILLSFWICVLMILASEPVLCSFYHPGLFLFFVGYFFILYFWESEFIFFLSFFWK